MGPLRKALFYSRTRIQVRAELQRRGYSFRDASDLASDLDDDTIDAAVVEADAVAQVSAIGDGRIIDAIIGFFKSPAGQMLLDLLLKLLIGGLLAVGPQVEAEQAEPGTAAA